MTPRASAGSSKDLSHLNLELKSEPPEQTEPIMASNLPESPPFNLDETTLNMLIPSGSTDTDTVMVSNISEVPSITLTILAPSVTPATSKQDEPKPVEKPVNINPVVCSEKTNVATDTVVLSTEKPSTKHKVEPLLKLQKMTTQEIDHARKLLIKKKPKPKVQVSKPTV